MTIINTFGIIIFTNTDTLREKRPTGKSSNRGEPGEAAKSTEHGKPQVRKGGKARDGREGGVSTARAEIKVTPGEYAVREPWRVHPSRGLAAARRNLTGRYDWSQALVVKERFA